MLGLWDDNVDWLLHFLVRRANKGAPPVRLALQVGDAQITGTLIGAAEYATGVGQQWGLNASSLATLVQGLGSEPSEAMVGFARSEDEGAVRLPFIHLRDARIEDPRGGISAQGYWRGRLDAIMGFIALPPEKK